MFDVPSRTFRQAVRKTGRLDPMSISMGGAKGINLVLPAEIFLPRHGVRGNMTGCPKIIPAKAADSSNQYHQRDGDRGHKQNELFLSIFMASPAGSPILRLDTIYR